MRARVDRRVVQPRAVGERENSRVGDQDVGAPGDRREIGRDRVDAGEEQAFRRP